MLSPALNASRGVNYSAHDLLPESFTKWSARGVYFFYKNIFNQVFNENRVILMLKSAAGGRASTFGFRSITLVCFGLLTPNLVHATNAAQIMASFFLHCHLSFLIPVTSILGWIVENLVLSHCGASCSVYILKWIYDIFI